LARNALTARPAAPPVVTASGNDILVGDARYGAFHRFIEPDELRFSGIQNCRSPLNTAGLPDDKAPPPETDRFYSPAI
jgi:hypothetical protein